MRSRARVLVIDDDPLFRSLIVGLLRRDFLVSVASEGSEGFYKALEHPPDIAVVDIQMPGWDGLRTLKAFKSHPALSHVDIVILTSDASKETVLAAIHGGASDYVIKLSFSKEEFRQKLDKLLPQQPPAEAAAEETAPSPATAAPRPKAVLAPHAPPDARSPQRTRGTDEDVRLQEVIDGWE